MKMFGTLVKPLCLCKAGKITGHCSRFVKGRVLDVGAGRCYIAREISKKCNVKVDCIDISDLNETEMNLKVYDGKNIPFKSGAFDTVLIVYVLHHCEDPIAVLKECKRVVKNGGRIIIFEDFGPVMYTHAVDWFVNKFLHGVEAPLNFKKSGEWKKVFRDLGMKLEYLEDGVEKQVFYPFVKHTMFVLRV